MSKQDGEYTGEDTEQMFHEHSPELDRKRNQVKSPIEVGSQSGPEGRAADFDLFGITGSTPKPDFSHSNIQMTPGSVSFPDGKSRVQEDFKRLKGFKERSQVYATFMWVMLAVAVAYGVFWLATETSKVPNTAMPSVRTAPAGTTSATKRFK